MSGILRRRCSGWRLLQKGVESVWTREERQLTLIWEALVRMIMVIAQDEERGPQDWVSC